MNELEEIRETFFQECDELLADLEAGLLKLEAGDEDAETINAVFRAVHSVKGGAGAFGLEALVRFAHVFETLLDMARSQKIELTPELVAVLLRAADILADHVSAAKGGGEGDPGATAVMAAELEAWTKGGPGAEGDTSSAEPAAIPADFSDEDLGFDFAPVAFDIPDVDGGPADSGDAWRISFRPGAALYAKANEAGLLIRELDRLGELAVELVADDLPTLDEIDPEGAYLAWTMRLVTKEPENRILDVFEFVEGDCDLTVEMEPAEGVSSGPDIAALIAAAQSVELEPSAFEPMESLEPLAFAPEPTEAPALIEPAAFAELPALEAVLEAAPAPAVSQEAVPGVAQGARANPAQAAAAADKSSQSTIRVDPERIDRLIDLVGELVINQAMLAQRVVAHGFAPTSDIAVGLDELEQLTRGIQDSVMAIRAQPVKSVFQRMPRLVREVAAQVGKRVRLVTEGEGTEVDKTVIEKISEPITHMLRNAIDHGLERPEDRRAAGKHEEGVVRLAALHRGGRIVIEVQDDGAGINRARVRQIALDKGLISPDAQLSDEEIDNLIFLPGFSTAKAVSDISGRGVGMDVVRKSVQGLGGRISITSRPGLGSTFTMSLPLTLAVLDGMVIEVAGQTFVVPLTAIVESLKPSPNDIRPLGPQGAVLAMRNTYVPMIDLGRTLGYRAEVLPPTDGVVLLVESEDGTRSALIADNIRGQRQVVIKSLEANYQQVPGIAAATILGDGRVALILDVDALVALRKREGAQASETYTYAAE
jgi:two-component system chemotaxis sensor kinase CheA